MKIGPQPGPQALLLSCPADEIMFGGARGGGKSYGTILAWVLHAAQYGQHAKGIAFRKSMPELEDFIATSRTILMQLGGWTWGEQKKTWYHTNGAVFKMRYLERETDAEVYQGQQFTFIVFEEAGNWSTPKAIDMMKACLRSAVPGLKKRILLTCNPGGAGHNWLKARFVDPAKPKTLIKCEGGWLRCFIPSRLEDNRILTSADPRYAQQIVEAARQMGEHLVKAWRDGSWDIVAGGMFDDLWNPEKQVLTSAMRIPKSWPVFLAHDWGSSAPSATLWLAESNGEAAIMPNGVKRCFPRGSIIVLHELYTTNGNPNEGDRSNAAQIAVRIRAINEARQEDWNICGPHVADSAIFATENANCIAQDYLDNGVDFEPAYKGSGSRVQGWERVRKLLICSGQDMPESPGLWIMDSCRHLLRTLPTLPRDKKVPDDVLTSSEDHLADALRYACVFKKTGMNYEGW